MRTQVHHVEVNRRAEQALLMPEDLIKQANLHHDWLYGPNYEQFGWRAGFEPASPKRDRESIWEWHRAINDSLLNYENSKQAL